MARTKKWRVGTHDRPTMTYLKPDQRRAVEAFADADGLPVSVWLRRLIVAEVGRRTVRDQLTQA